jgi:hypothetical protein
LFSFVHDTVAQVVSQIGSHIVIYYQRKIEHSARQQYETQQMESFEAECAPTTTRDTESLPADQSLSGRPMMDNGLVDYESTEKESLANHQFSRLHRAESETLRVRLGVNPGVVTMTATTVLLVLIASCLPTFAFDIRGLVGVVAQIGSGTYRNYSVYNIAQSLMDQARLTGKAKDFIGMAFISILFVSTIVFVPIALAVALLIQWIVPITVKQRDRMNVIIETLGAWQYIEVYILAIIVGAWQIGDISSYLLDDYCANITEFLSQLVFYGIIEPQDAQCFRVVATIKSGAYIYVIASAFLAVLGAFVGKAVYQLQYFRESNIFAVLSRTQDDMRDEMPMKGTPDDMKPVPVLFTDSFRWLLTSTNKSTHMDHRAEENSLAF